MTVIFNTLRCIFFIKPVNRICSWLSRVLLQQPPDAKKVLTPDGVVNNQTQTRGVLLGILGGGVLPGSSNPDPISDQKKNFPHLFSD